MKDEPQLVEVHEEISKLSNRTKNFLNYELELSLLSLKMGIKDNIKGDLASYFLDALQVEVEYENIDGSLFLTRIPHS